MKHIHAYIMTDNVIGVFRLAVKLIGRDFNALY